MHTAAQIAATLEAAGRPISAERAERAAQRIAVWGGNIDTAMSDAVLGPTGSPTAEQTSRDVIAYVSAVRFAAAQQSEAA